VAEQMHPNGYYDSESYEIVYGAFTPTKPTSGATAQWMQFWGEPPVKPADVPGTAATPDEIDLNGRTDAKDEGIEYLGTAKRQADGKYHALANVHGALCTVEVSVRPSGVKGDDKC